MGFFLAVILSPLLLWGSQSLHSERDFLQSKTVSSETVQDGYVSISGSPQVETVLNCPQINLTDEVDSCLFVNQETLEYQAVSSIVCGYNTPSSSYRIIKQAENRCDETGGSCQSCYQVEKYEWVSLDKQITYSPFKLGAFIIKPTEKTNFVSEINGEYFVNASGERRGQNEIVAIGDKNYKFTYFPVSETVLVAGSSYGGIIEGGDGGVFVISDKSREGTAMVLSSEDKILGSFMSTFSLIVMVFGFMFLVSPLTTWLRHVFGALLPGLDKLLGRGASWLVYLAAGLIGGLIWWVLSILVFLVKNVWWAMVILVVVGLPILLILNQKKNKKVEAIK